MLKKISIQDIGPIKNKEISFTRFNLIYGNNEAGKTAITDILSQITISGIGTAEVNKFKANTGFNKDRFASPPQYNVEGENTFTLKENGVITGDIYSLAIIRSGESELKIGKEKDIASSSYWSSGIKALFDGKDETVKRIEKITTLFTSNSKIWSVIPALKEHKKTIAQSKNSFSTLQDRKNSIADSDNRLNAINEQIAQFEALKSIANYKRIDTLLNSWNDTELKIKQISNDAPKKIENLRQAEDKYTILIDESTELKNRAAELKERISSLNKIVINIESKHKLLIVLTAIGALGGFTALFLPLYVSIISFIVALFALGQLLVRMKDSRTIKEQIETFEIEQIDNDKKLAVNEHLIQDFKSEYTSLNSLIEKRVKLEQELASVEILTQENKQRFNQLCFAFKLDSINYARESYAISLKLKNYSDELLQKSYSPNEHAALLEERELIQTSLRKDDVDLANQTPTLLHQTQVSYSEISKKIPQNGMNFYNSYLLPHINKTEIVSLYDLDAGLLWCDVAIEEITKIKNYVEELKESINNVLHNQSEYIITIFDRTDFKKFFQHLTGYESITVSSDSEQVTLKVVSDKNEYPFDSLSTGTKHQFYFCLRLALLNAIAEIPGILVLDDAFLHFDKTRRIKGINILKEMANSGWQIIYTAVDDDVIAKLFEDANIEELNVVKI